MLRRLIPNTLFAAQFLFSAHPSSAQSAMPSSSCPCTLQGSVVDSVSGQPVPHALVKLATNSPRATLTDSEGKFQFEGLPAGSVTLETVKPGYLGNDGFSPWSGSVASFQLGPDAAPALLKLTPEGVISGQVCDENGEPLEGFTVSVLLRAPQDKRLYPDQRHSAVTDDEGKFRIAGMHPASYYLEARQAQAPVLNATGESSIPSGYSLVFYPRSSDSASAVPIKVPPGKTVQANFSLKREPFIRLSGTVSGYNPQEQVVLMLWDASGMPQNSEISFDPATGAFHTKWIPPGTYTLTAQSTGLIPVDAASAVSLALQSGAHISVGLRHALTDTLASLRVNANSSHTDLHFALQPSLDIPVAVHGLTAVGSDTQQAQRLMLRLVSKEPEFRAFDHFVSSMNPEGEALSGDMHWMFTGIPPGEYEFKIESLPNADYYAESATWGSTDLLRDDLVLDSSGATPPIDLVLREDGATLNGTVVFGATRVPALVVLQADKHKTPILQLAGPTGTFTFPGLAPGTYRVFAVDASAPFDYEDPTFLAKISSKIQEVTLAPRQSTSINLELAAVGE
jgi:hypothetical protein